MYQMVFIVGIKSNFAKRLAIDSTVFLGLKGLS